MALDIFSAALTAIGTSTTGLAGFVLRSFLKRIQSIEDHFLDEGDKGKQGRVVLLEKQLASLTQRVGQVLDMDEELDARIKRIVQSVIARASVADHAVVKSTVNDGIGGLRREVDLLREELKAVKSLAQTAAQESQLADHIAGEAARWSEVNRALGVIEGMLEVVRSKARMADERRR